MRLFKLTPILFVAAAIGQTVAPSRAADASKGERYALLVGVHKYSEARELRPLPFAENDMTELASVLRDGGYKQDNVVLLTQAAGADELRFLPMKARVLKELRLLLANRDENDTVLLAFAGHGVIFKDDPVSYFCPADAQLDDKETLLSLTDVYRELEGCKAGTKVLLVDACRNDPLKDGTRAPIRLKLESVTRPPEPAKDGGVAAFFSCSRGQKAYEDEKSKHGAFFHFVIEGLKGEASVGHDEVTLLELGAYVQRRVSDFTRVEYQAEQKPEMTNASSQGAAALILRAADYIQAYRRGMKLQEQKEFKKAADEFTEAIRLNPKYAPAFNDRGQAWYQEKEYDKAMADYDVAIRVDPKFAKAFTYRGRVWKTKGEIAKAMADYNEAIRLDPKDYEAFFNRAYSWYEKNEYDKAIGDLDQAIRLNPTYARSFQERGYNWYQKKEYDKAIADFDEAIRLDPKDATTFKNRGANWSNKGEYDKALADFDAAIRLDPQYADAFIQRGVVYFRKSEYDKAIAEFNEAIRLDPKSARAFRNRGINWIKKEEYDKALADIDVAIGLDPINAASFNERGFAYYKKKKYYEAIGAFNEAVRLDPQFVKAFINRGNAWQASGEQARADADFEKARKLGMK